MFDKDLSDTLSDKNIFNLSTENWKINYKQKIKSEVQKKLKLIY